VWSQPSPNFPNTRPRICFLFFQNSFTAPPHLSTAPPLLHFSKAPSNTNPSARLLPAHTQTPLPGLVPAHTQPQITPSEPHTPLLHVVPTTGPETPKPLPARNPNPLPIPLPLSRRLTPAQTVFFFENDYRAPLHRSISLPRTTQRLNRHPTTIVPHSHTPLVDVIPQPLLSINLVAAHTVLLHHLKSINAPEIPSRTRTPFRRHCRNPKTPLFEKP